MPVGFYHRFGLPLILGLALIVPLAAYASLQVLGNSSNDRNQWLPQSFQAAQDFQTFKRRFESQDAVLVSWPGCTVDDERLDEFAAGLMKQQTSDEPLFAGVLSGRELLQQMTSAPRNIPREEALKRLEGVVVGPDLDTTCAIVRIADYGGDKPEEVVQQIKDAAKKYCDLSSDELHLGGTLVDMDATNRASDRLFYDYSRLSALISLAIAFLCLRHLKLVVALFYTALLATGLGMLLFWFSNQPMNILLMMLPALWFTLAISGSIHFINYYRDAASEDPHLAAEHAVRKGWLPCTLATATTSIGLGSLMVCDIVPVFLFGVFSALGLLTGLALIFLLLPSILAKWVSAEKLHVPRLETADDKQAHTRSWRFWSGVTDALSRVHPFTSLAFFAAMVLLGCGLIWIYPSAKLQDYFPADSRIYSDYVWLETNVAPLMPLEVALEIDDESQLSLAERMELSNRVERAIEQIQFPGSDRHAACYSATTLIPEIPEKKGFRNILRRNVLLAALEEDRDKFAAARYIVDDQGLEIWRITVRVAATSPLDYGEFADEVEKRVNDVLQGVDEKDGKPVEHVTATITGPVRLVSRIQQALLDVLYKSFALAFLLIGLTMMAALRNIPGGIVAMAPNLFPVLATFGAMGWAGKPLDVGSIMTASVALGIAVDDTFHFLIWYSRGRQAGKSQRDSVFEAYRHCGVAMTQTSLICGCGLLVFLLSEFSPAARFGGLMFAMLMTALVGDLVFLPSLLLGPAGRLFRAAPQAPK